MKKNILETKEQNNHKSTSTWSSANPGEISPRWRITIDNVTDLLWTQWPASKWESRTQQTHDKHASEFRRTPRKSPRGVPKYRSGIDEGNHDVAGAVGGGQSLVVVGESARVHEHPPFP